MKRIKSGDTVVIIAGRSINHVGKVLKVSGERVIVEGGNLIKKHIKPNPQLNESGGIKSIEAPLHISNVAMYNPLTKEADKVGFKLIDKDGKTYKVRYFKSNNEIVDHI